MKTWLKATAVRVIKTMAETALSMMTVGQLVMEVDWLGVLSVSAVSGVIAFLTCIKGLPEVDARNSKGFTRETLDELSNGKDDDYEQQ